MHAESNEHSDWPAEMTIRVASNPVSLLELLWVRHMSGLTALPELPMAALPDPEARNDSIELANEWERAWSAALTHILSVQETEPLILSNRPDLWEAPSIGGLASTLGVTTTGLEQWNGSLESAEGAEHRVIPQIHAAWKRGLRVVIELPLRGYYSSRCSAASIVVSTETRAAPHAYASALTSS